MSNAKPALIRQGIAANALLPWMPGHFLLARVTIGRGTDACRVSLESF
ncbi:hypothetical protein [Mesorhizobium sp. CAU 1732]